MHWELFREPVPVSSFKTAMSKRHGKNVKTVFWPFEKSLCVQWIHLTFISVVIRLQDTGSICQGRIWLRESGQDRASVSYSCLLRNSFVKRNTHLWWRSFIKMQNWDCHWDVRHRDWREWLQTNVKREGSKWEHELENSRRRRQWEITGDKRMYNVSLEVLSPSVMYAPSPPKT